MMKDKQVGELWKSAKYLQERGSSVAIVEAAFAVEELIRKLVEERAKRFHVEQGIAGGTAGFYKALRDFGIDPKEWKP